MRQQAMSEKMLYGRPIPVARIVQGISDSGSQSLARLHPYKAMHRLVDLVEVVSDVPQRRR